jgi:hypothetical protein
MTNALDIIEQKESGGRNVYQGLVPRDVSSASGHFQMIKPTWQRWARAVGVDTGRYPEAIDAPYDVQRQVAEHGFRTEGFSPWKATAGLVGQEANYSANAGGGGGVLSANGTASAPSAFDLHPYLAAGKSLEGVNASLQDRLSHAIQSMPEDLRKGFAINSSYRSPEQQQRLWDAALQKYGSPEAARKWVAPPGHSQHGEGNALDLGYGSDAQRDWIPARQ